MTCSLRTDPSRPMMASRFTTPLIPAVLARAGYTGATLRISLALCTSVLTRMVWGAAFFAGLTSGGGGGGNGTVYGVLLKTPPGTPPGVPPGTLPSCAMDEPSTRGGPVTSSTSRATSSGIVVGACKTSVSKIVGATAAAGWGARGGAGGAPSGGGGASKTLIHCPGGNDCVVNSGINRATSTNMLWPRKETATVQGRWDSDRSSTSVLSNTGLLLKEGPCPSEATARPHRESCDRKQPAAYVTFNGVDTVVAGIVPAKGNELRFRGYFHVLRPRARGFSIRASVPA